MYSDAVQERLDAADISPGDRVRVEAGGTTYEGRLMPRARQGDQDVLVVKLDNGYNTGVAIDDATIEKVADQEPVTGDTPDIPAYDEEDPDIAVLHTGGTIASRVSYEEGGVKPALDAEDLAQLYPELFDLANIECETVAQMLSEDMEPAHWQQLAEAVADHRDKDGIIIGHGTDTMHYTGAALSFMLHNIDVPVVLVGAQRSSDRPSSDAALNLLSAARFIQEDVPGVYICMHANSSDDAAAVHHGARARKLHTSRRDAFRSIDTRPVATVDHADDVTFHRDPSTLDGAFTLRTGIETDVGLLYARPGLTVEDVQHHADRAGVVVAGTGLGHLPVNAFDDHTQHHDAILDAVDALADDGVVAMASQCLNGRVNMHVYDAGVKIQEAGVVSAGTMTPETAYVKLMWALGQTASDAEAAELFREDVAGELVDREEYDAFGGDGGAD